MHIPVLLQEVMKVSQLEPGDHCIDGTVGGGGHAQALLELTAPSGVVIGFDRDRTTLLLTTERLRSYGERFIPIHGSMADLAQHRDVIDARQPIKAIIADLGLSSLQLDSEQRGFAFRFHAPLDMRFDQSRGQTAAELLNSADVETITHWLRSYGEEPRARVIAQSLIDRRPIRVTTDVLAAIDAVIKPRPGQRIHPATRTFQALRIVVNQELEHIERFLPTALETLSSGGRLAIISFHSLEDRLVKQWMKLAARDCICPPEFPVCRCDHRATVRLITSKPITPSEAELHANPRSRSAKLRVIEKI